MPDSADMAGVRCPGPWLNGDCDETLEEPGVLNAISRADGRTYVCRKCGRREAEEENAGSAGGG